MDETAEDLAALDALLARSYAAAGSHLLGIHSPRRRLDAREVTARRDGMRLLALATVTSGGLPIVGPVDGVFHRGAFHFGSSRDSVRMRHIRVRRAVSAAHLPGEEWAVTVHGHARILDLRDPAEAGLRECLLQIYTPRYGAGWEEFMDAAVYARIEPERMFAARFDIARTRG